MKRGLLISALLCAVTAHAQEGLGQAGGLDEPLRAERATMRLRASVGGVVAAGWVPVRNDVQVAPGVTAEVGGIFGDRTSLSVRLTFATIGVMSVLQLNAGVGFALGERLWTGIGLGAQYLGALTAFNAQWTAVVVPVRFEYLFATRAPTEVRRKGVFAFAEFSPGFIVGFGGQPFPTMSGAIGAGWAWW